MVDTYTQGKLGLIEPARGSYVDVWDSPLYANWQVLEAAISGTTTLNLTNSNVVLTVPTYPAYVDPPTVSTSTQNLRLLLTGTPSVNLTIYIPATVSGLWIVDDATLGSSTLTVKTTAAGSVGINSIRGQTVMIFCDGTDVKLADSGSVNEEYLVQTGSIISFGGISAPTGYLLCDGSAVSRATYSALFSVISTVWGIGDGLTTFNVPNLTDMFLRGSGSSSVGVYEADTYLNHTHNITDPGHAHGLHVFERKINGDSEEGDNTVRKQDPAQNDYIASNTTGITINNSTTGGTETRPKNKRVLYIIKT